MTDSSMTVVEVEGFKLVEIVGEEEPRVIDTDIAESLGLKQTRNVRILVKKMIKSKELLDVHCRISKMRQSTGNGGSREYDVTEYLLTEHEAIVVAMRSDAEKAVAFRRQIAAVFKAWRHGQLVPTTTTALAPAQPPQAMITMADIRALVAEIVPAIVRAIQAPQDAATLDGKPVALCHGDTVGQSGHDAISFQLKSAAALYPSEAYSSIRAQLENKFRQRTNYPRVRGADFARFPRARWHHAVSVLRDIREDAERTVAMFRGQSGQTSLFPLGPKSRRRRPSAH